MSKPGVSMTSLQRMLFFVTVIPLCTIIVLFRLIFSIINCVLNGCPFSGSHVVPHQYFIGGDDLKGREHLGKETSV